MASRGSAQAASKDFRYGFGVPEAVKNPVHVSLRGLLLPQFLSAYASAKLALVEKERMDTARRLSARAQSSLSSSQAGTS